MDLDRLAVAACDRLDDFVEIGNDGADKPAGSRADEDAVCHTQDRPLLGEARQRAPVNVLPFGNLATAARTALAMDTA